MTLRRIFAAAALAFAAALAIAPAPATAATDVLTNNYDNNRTGADLSETILSPKTVNAFSFTKQFTYSVDAPVQAQPLVASGVGFGGGVTRNVVYVATMNASLYAFDADASPGQGTTPIWGPVALGTPISGGPQGIRGTPVIDRSTNTIFAVSINKNTNPSTNPTHPSTCHGPDPSNPCNNALFNLYAVDMTTGAIKNSAIIDASVTVGGQSVGLSFTKNRPGFAVRIQRPALALAGNTILVAFSGQSDVDYYNGWVVAYDKATLVQTGAFCTTCASTAVASFDYHHVGTLSAYGTGSCAFGGPGGGIWQKGRAPVVDANGIAYYFTGNKLALLDVTYCQRYQPKVDIDCLPDSIVYACPPNNLLGDDDHDSCPTAWPDGSTEPHQICTASDTLKAHAASPAGPSSFDTNESVVALDTTAGTVTNPSLPLTGWFQPAVWNSLSDIFGLEVNDLDLSASGPVLLPGTTTLIGGGKLGIMYLLDTTQLAPPTFPMTPSSSLPIQSFSLAPQSTVPDSTEINGPVVWSRPDANGGTLVYVWRGTDYLRSYRIENNRFVNGNGTPCTAAGATVSLAANSTCTAYAHGADFLNGQTGSEPPSPTLTLSANGTTKGSGIIWASISDPSHGQAGILRAYNADVLGQELYTSDTCPGDKPGAIVRFTPPTVANGRVYVATSNAVVAYGLGVSPCTVLQGAIRQLMDDP